MIKKSFVLLMIMVAHSTLFSSVNDIWVRDLNRNTIRISPGTKGISGADIKRKFIETLDGNNPEYFCNYGPTLHDQHLGLFSIINAGKAVKDTDMITKSYAGEFLTIDQTEFAEALEKKTKLPFNRTADAMQFLVECFQDSVHGVGMNTGVSLRRALFKLLYKRDKDFFKYYGDQLKNEHLSLLNIIRSGKALNVDFVGNIGVDRLHFKDTLLRQEVEKLNKEEREKEAQEHQEYREAASSFMGRLAQRIKTVEEQVVDAASSVASELEEELD